MDEELFDKGIFDESKEKILSDQEDQEVKELERENNRGIPEFVGKYFIAFIGILVIMLAIQFFQAAFIGRNKFFEQSKSYFSDINYNKKPHEYYDFTSINFENTDDYSSNSVLVFDLTANRAIFSKNSDNQTLIASLTKLASTKVLFDNVNLTDEVVITEDIEKIGGSELELKKGQKFTKLDLIKAGVIVSSNQSVFIANQLEETVRQMNDLAQILKLEKTNFDNPAGFDEGGNNYSSASELVLIAKLFFDNEVLKEYASTPFTTIKELSENKEISIKNTNDLLTLNTPGVISGKTGTTPQAGQNLLLLVEKNGREYLVILLNGTDRYEDAYKVLERL